MAGGWIPGLEPDPAYTLSRPAGSAIPVLIAVPHAGRAYPPELIDVMRNPAFATLRLEDRYVDLVAREVSRRTGATLLVAQAPRAMLDLNRAPDDIDWEMFEHSGTGERPFSPPGRRSRSGLGLFPRRLHGLGELWKGRLGPGIVAERLAAIHAPYHAALSEEVERLRARWGASLLLDLHSMPPLVPRHAGDAAIEFVIGDRFGTSCDGALVGAVFGWLMGAGRRAAHNRPYAGGYVLERHARTRRGIHAMQLEVDRLCYLDRHLQEPGAGFADTVELLTGLVQRLARETALLGQSHALKGDDGWAIAAE